MSSNGFVPGRPHPDGRRYLPSIILGLPDAPPDSLPRIGVVDRHHRVDPALEGRAGAARLVFLLSSIRRLDTLLSGLFDPLSDSGRASTMPEAYGRVVAVPVWEARHEHLPYESLYAEN